MCGIVGYIGKSSASPILLDGLRRLEYRGYDSAGLATIDGGQIETRKCKGRIQALADLLKENGAAGHVGISHTRWATHGQPNDANAHPHFDQSGRLARGAARRSRLAWGRARTSSPAIRRRSSRIRRKPSS